MNFKKFNPAYMGLIIFALILSACNMPGGNDATGEQTPVVPFTPTAGIPLTHTPASTAPTSTPTAIQLPTQAPTHTPAATATNPVTDALRINVYKSDSGEVMLNHDDGDSTMGTLLNIDIVNADGESLNILMPPMFSSDVECEKCEMVFYTDHFDPKATTEQMVAFANAMHPGAEYLIWAGKEEDTPDGWVFIDDAEFSWGTIKSWKYTQVAIQPKGLYTNPDGIFVSVDAGERQFTADGTVLYGQFWKPGTDGEIWHFQVADGACIQIPFGYQGKFWSWEGDFEVGMEDLQRRMIQATASEVVDRDEITQVNLLLFGELPTNVDKKLMSFEFNGETITWTAPDEDSPWICK